MRRSPLVIRPKWLQPNFVRDLPGVSRHAVIVMFVITAGVRSRRSDRSRAASAGLDRRRRQVGAYPRGDLCQRGSVP
jgi:hypothetical protein